MAKGKKKRGPERRKLTDRFVRTVEPGSERRVYWDTETGGLGLQVQPTGHRSWKVVYRHGGRPRWYNLGSYPALGLAEARPAARHIMARVALGEDPQGDKVKAREGEVLREVAERYVNEWARRNNKSWEQAEALMRRHVLPKLGSRKIAEITRRDVRRLFDKITTDHPTLANQVLAAASAVFTWALEKDLVEVNPARGIRRNPTKRRERFLDVAELRVVWPAFDDHGMVRSFALKTVLLTAQRPGEVRHMRWEHVDGRWWNMPGAKSEHWPGTKNHLDHRVYFSDAVVAILDEIGPAPEGHVFASARGRPVSTLSTATGAITEALGLRERFTPHSLRATAASHLSRMGVPKDTIAKLLNHAEGGVTGGYIRHSFDDEKQRALERWERRLDDIIRGRTEGAEIVPLAR